MDQFISLLSDGWGTDLLKGLAVTMEISIGGFATGLSIGGLLAWTKLRGPTWAIALAYSYSTVCRAVPEILLILILFYAGQSGLNVLMSDLGFETVAISGFVTAIAVLGIVQGAYASEILRGAVLAVPKGQVEAARAYGLHGMRLFRRTILPLIVPYAFDGLSNLWMAILKDSVLVSVVGYNELTFTAAQAAGATKLYFEVYILTGAIYYSVTQISYLFMRKLESRVRCWMPRLGQ